MLASETARVISQDLRVTRAETRTCTSPTSGRMEVCASFYASGWTGPRRPKTLLGRKAHSHSTLRMSSDSLGTLSWHLRSQVERSAPSGFPLQGWLLSDSSLFLRRRCAPQAPRCSFRQRCSCGTGGRRRTCGRWGWSHISCCQADFVPPPLLSMPQSARHVPCSAAAVPIAADEPLAAVSPHLLRTSCSAFVWIQLGGMDRD